MYLAFDTETSGLPIFRDEATGKPVPADDPCQPRLAEIGMVYLDANMMPERESHHYIRPEGWEMTEEATATNKLTTEFLNDMGRPIVEVLNEYQNAILEGRVVLAHNAQFDCKMMRGELRRAGLDDLFMKTKNSCTMRAFPQGMIEKANGKKGWPQLGDAAKHTGYVLAEAHTAIDDARAVAHIAKWLKEHDMLQEPGVHMAKGR